MSTANLNEQATVLASLILADDKIDITSDKILTILKAADITIEPIWASLFAKAFEGKDVSELLLNVGSGAAAAPAAAGSAPAAGGAAAAPKAEAKEEAKEESDEDMGFGLFD